jgi:hypothetical protein
VHLDGCKAADWSGTHTAVSRDGLDCASIANVDDRQSYLFGRGWSRSSKETDALGR